MANEARSAELAIYHLISNALSWNKCYIYIYIYMFRRNNNVVSPRGKLELLIILIGVVPLGKKSNIKLGK